MTNKVSSNGSHGIVNEIMKVFRANENKNKIK